jgi:hypothetical protein
MIWLTKRSKQRSGEIRRVAGSVARQNKTHSQGPCPTCRIHQRSFLSTPPERGSPLSRPRLPLGLLPSVVMIRNTGRKEPVSPDQHQEFLKMPDGLGKSLKTPPRHLYLKNPPTPPHAPGRVSAAGNLSIRGEPPWKILPPPGAYSW